MCNKKDAFGKSFLIRSVSSLILSLVFLYTVAASKPDIIVAKDGTGNVTTVQQAFDKVPNGNTKQFTIFVKNGEYKERLTLAAKKDFVSLIGEDKTKTILTYDNHTGSILPNGDTVNTMSSASLFIYANDFHAENITVQNNAGFSAGQAVAVFAFGDRISFKNCKLKGFQDVLFCSGPGTKQYYRDCYIEGTTDFIFGSATAVFKDCLIHSKKNSHVTAASTPKEIPFGFVFIDCKLTADSGSNKVSLGRPWKPYAAVAYIHCYIDKHIIAEGWSNWKNTDNEKTARYVEYENAGPGADLTGRVSWSRQLTNEEYETKYTIKNILGDWKPEEIYDL